MAFTFSHPAIIVPLRKSGLDLSTTALIAGSVVPDLEYYLRMCFAGNLGHQWYGIVLLDLPAAWLLCYAFHHLFRDELIRNLPNRLKCHVPAAGAVRWNNQNLAKRANILASILIGIGSHFLWDSFTHQDGFIVKMFPQLATPLDLVWWTLPLYEFLQITTSLVGLLALMNVAGRQKPVSIIERNSEPITVFWMAVLMLAMTVCLVRFCYVPDEAHLWDIFAAVVGSLMYAIVAVVLLKRAFNFSIRRQYRSFDESFHSGRRNPVLHHRTLFVKDNQFLKLLLQYMVGVDQFIHTGKIGFRNVASIDVDDVVITFTAPRDLFSQIIGIFSREVPLNSNTNTLFSKIPDGKQTGGNAHM